MIHRFWIAGGFLVGVAILALISAGQRHVLVTTSGMLRVEQADTVQFMHTDDGRCRGTVLFTNSGPGAALIRSATAGCGCTSVSVSRAEVLSGGQSELSIVIDPASALRSGVAKPKWDLGKLDITVNCSIHGDFESDRGIPGKLMVQAKGNVDLPFRIPDGEFNFGQIDATSAAALRRVTIICNAGCRLGRPSASIPGVSIKTIESSLSGTETLEVSITPKSILGLKQLSYIRTTRGHIILPVTRDSGHEIRFPIPFSLEIVPEISARPHRLIFGPLFINESQIQALEFFSNPTSLKEIVRIEMCSEQANGPLIKSDVSTETGRRVELEWSASTPVCQSCEMLFLVYSDEAVEPTRVSIPVTFVARKKETL